MTKEEQIDLLFDTAFGALSIREIVDKAYDMGRLSGTQAPLTNKEVLAAAQNNIEVKGIGYGFKEALEVVKRVIRTDRELFLVYRDNISMCFQDRYVVDLPLKEIANEAAENFLNLFCSE